MAGVKGRSGGWNKRSEIEWRDLWQMTKEDLMRHANWLQNRIKKFGAFEEAYKDEAFRKLYNKWLEIESTIFCRGIPQKIDAKGLDSPKQFVVVFPPGIATEKGLVSGNSRESVLS